MAAALMKYETVDEEQLKDIMAGRMPQAPSDWDETGAAERRPGRRQARAGHRPAGQPDLRPGAARAR